MYICICKGITEDKLLAAKKGSKNHHDVLKKLGVGDDCGVCLISALERLESQTKKSSSKK